MRVVVFEDDDTKWNNVQGVLVQKGIKPASIKRLTHIAQFLEVSDRPFDLCIIDLMMPGISGTDPRNAGVELLKMLDYSGKRRVPTLAITAYREEAAHQQKVFSSYGCIIYNYDERQIWSDALDIFISQAKEKGRYDFLVFAALKEERDAYLPLLESLESTQRGGLDLLECEVGGASGAIILLPRMGIINAAVVTARALEFYSPSVVAMSGICGGVGSNAEMGQLLIADIVWEYQSGKWIDEAFEAEPYQVSISQSTRLTISKLIDQVDLLADLEASFRGSTRPSQRVAPKLAPFATGSAVIASEARLSSVKDQHRKVAGLDMEVFGFHRAVELSGQTPKAFCAKVVVDKARLGKGDALHEYGCSISAKFVVSALPLLLAQHSQ
uniref:Response regulator receiver domain-containing protein n=1 Tax=Rhodopseudomonas palustris (strain DX-1) TaxID=652103 RepID=E6VQ19_RHOPX